METTLLFKTLVILSAQLSIVLFTCLYCLNGARKAYENNTSFLGMFFRGSVNMKGQLDLIPYAKVKEGFPKEMTNQDAQGNDFIIGCQAHGPPPGRIQPAEKGVCPQEI